MIKAITVLTDGGEELFIDLFDPSTSGMYVKTVGGIGPVKADIGVSDYAALDGGIYTGSRTPKRNITLTLGFTWDPTIEEVRHRCYMFFRVKSLVRLTFHTDRMDLQAVGYVESNTPNIFSKDESADISVICPDPYFRKVVNGQPYAEIFENFGGVENLFEFPFMNNSLTQNELVFGNQQLGSVREIQYDGEEPSHLIWYAESKQQINFQTPTKMLMRNLTFDEELTLNFGPGKLPMLPENGRITVSGVIGNKGCWLDQVGFPQVSFLQSLKIGNNGWPRLHPGINRLQISMPGYDSILSGGVQYYTLYGGI